VHHEVTIRSRCYVTLLRIRHGRNHWGAEYIVGEFEVGAASIVGGPSRPELVRLVEYGTVGEGVGAIPLDVDVGFIWRAEFPSAGLPRGVLEYVRYELADVPLVLGVK